MAEEKERSDPLLPEKIRRKLNPLMLIARRIRAGSMKGERRSVRRGTSIEFADYRDYAPGDDLRRLDWNIYARLDRPYIKLFEDEEDLAVHIILDVSASMDWPQESEDLKPTFSKLLFAKRLFAGLSYVSLTSNDALLLTVVNDFGLNHFGPVRGSGQGVAMLRYVQKLKAEGLVDLNDALSDYALRVSRPGLCLIISDMFSPTGWVDGVNALLSKGHEVAILHVLAPEEVTPPLAGDLRLVDVETGGTREVTIDATLRTIYEKRLEAWREGIRIECVSRGVHYLMLQSDMPWERVILQDMRRLGLVK